MNALDGIFVLLTMAAACAFALHVTRGERPQAPPEEQPPFDLLADPGARVFGFSPERGLFRAGRALYSDDFLEHFATIRGHLVANGPLSTHGHFLTPEFTDRTEHVRLAGEYLRDALRPEVLADVGRTRELVSRAYALIEITDVALAAHELLNGGNNGTPDR